MAGYRPYGYQYETSPRKLQPEYDYPRTNYKKKKSTSVKRGKAKQTVKKAVKKQSKRKLKYNVKPVLYIAIAFAMLLTVSYRYSLINENYNNKESLKSQLGEIEKENEHTEQDAIDEIMKFADEDPEYSPLEDYQELRAFEEQELAADIEREEEDGA